ncbi:hypothetical protein [Streptomyces sp. NP-1717]|uniref:hypothetical protein n=1 Tax=unclassified Streptomyces TaxID=2593676 RepID=UPI001F5D1BEF|nr:hypothetical protein [Streptomyces sp. NP-1717]WTA73435.1 hypothetical protein OG705_11340 [Streptomyces sp. NBC_00838]
MSGFDQLLGTDFGDRPTSDTDEVIYAGLDHPERHRARVPGLVAVLTDSAAPDRERFLACAALTTWGEPAGYRAVADAAESGKRAPWYGILVDRKFSVDSTFAQLAVALGDSRDMAEEKGTLAQRESAFRALVRIADTEYFEDQLGDLLEESTARALLADIGETVDRGVRSLTGIVGVRPHFDLATQLVDLASAVASVDGVLAARLAMAVLEVEPSRRALVHAVTVLHRSSVAEVRRLGSYMIAVGDERVRGMATDALRPA